ncbi:MAG: hypothetical protein Q9220_004853 [cf. Caloplaca sp. 1 TL-2023]
MPLPPRRYNQPRPLGGLSLYRNANFQRLLQYESNRRLHSEFPSLSGAPQTQYQNPGQAVWGNPNPRIAQHTPVQRPQQQHPVAQQANSQQQPPQTSQAQEQPQQSRESMFSSTQPTSSNDDYHRGGQGGIGQLGASTRPQPSNVEDFPPLGRNGLDENQQDRRGSLMQNAAFGSYLPQFPLPQNQDRAPPSLSSLQNSHGDNRSNTTLVDRTMSPSSLSFASSSNRLAHTPSVDTDRSVRYSFPPSTGHVLTNQQPLPTPRASQQQNSVNALLSSFQNHNLGPSSSSSTSQNGQQQQPPQSRPQQQGPQPSLSPAQIADTTPLDEMAPIDRWGLAGLFSQLRSPDPDVIAMAIGQDLTQLGMDLDSPE